MRRNIYFHENNSEKGIYRSLKGGFNGFTLLALSLLKSPFSLFILLSFQPSQVFRQLLHSPCTMRNLVLYLLT